MSTTPGNVVNKLELLPTAASRKQSIHVSEAGSSAAICAAIGPPIIEGDVSREGSLSGREVCNAENGRIPVAAGYEVVNKIRCDRVGVVDLGNGPRLVALLIEDWTERAGSAGLNAPVAANPEIDLLPVVDVVVDAARCVSFRIKA